MLVVARWDDRESTGRHSVDRWHHARAVVVFLLAAAACHPPGQGAAKSVGREPPTAAGSSSPPTVRLIVAGSEPRRQLRFHVPVRTRTRFEMDASLGPVQFEAYVPERTGDHGSVVLVKPLDPDAATSQGLGGTGEGSLDDRGFVEYWFLPTAAGAAVMGYLPRGSTRPGVDYFPFDPTNGPGCVEHCHILVHEDNEVMRPMLIGK